MKRIYYLVLLSSTAMLSQVGIGTVTPNATLEIKSSNEATPANTDGLLIPKIEEFPATNPTVLQDGMMVFATGAGAVAKGFYSWDSGSTSWVLFGGARQINDLADGKSDATGSSIFIGSNAGSMDDGTNNINIGIGFESLMSTVNGVTNVGVGYQSLQSLGSGSGNTAIGHRTMRLAAGGSSNVALGPVALENNFSGSDNVALGTAALRSNASGEYNTAIGSVSLFNNTSGDSNISIGRASMNVNEIGSNNIAFGNYAGYFVEGDDNIFIGENAGGLGNGTGTHAKNGSVFIGSNAGATEIVSNRLYIENSNSTAPLIYGEFDNDIVGINGNLGIGTQAPSVPLHITEDGTSNVQTIVAGLGSNISNRPVLQFSETANMGLAEGMSLEYNGTGTAGANRMVINNVGGSPLFEFRNGGSLTLTGGSLFVNHPSGSGTEGLALRNTTDADTWRLYTQWNSNTLALLFNNVNVGNFDDVSGAYTAISDRNLKKNIAPTASVLNQIQQLQVVDYNFKLQKDNKKYTGLIAQEVQQVFPHLVVPPNEESDNYTMDYSGFGVLAIKAIQEQQVQIELLKKELSELKTRLKTDE